MLDLWCLMGPWSTQLDPEYPRKVTEIINSDLAHVLRLWSNTLRDAGVNIKAYMIEEEKQILQRNKEDDWRSYWSPHLSCIEWEFHLEETAEDCFIAATYEYRPNTNTEITENMPGAWSNDFDTDG